MHNLLSYIIWDSNPILFTLGSFEARWYGLLFASAFFFGQYFITKIFRGEGKPDRDVETITVYMMVATVVGARLGHCLFYEPEYYLSHPIEILKIWKGGLASHGATVGIIAAMYFYSRNRPGQSMLWILDRIVIVVALGGFFIRMGNLMNSEIVGKPTDVPWAFVFAAGEQAGIGKQVMAYAPEGMIDKVEYKDGGADIVADGGEQLRAVDLKVHFAQGNEASIAEFGKNTLPTALKMSDLVLDNYRLYASDLTPKVQGQTLTVRLAGVPRHPSQLYEALSTFALFLLLYTLWNKMKEKTPEGLFFGIFVVVLFSLRFFYEFYKENQVEFEDELTFNLGQLLSIPMVIIGIAVLGRALLLKKKETLM